MRNRKLTLAAGVAVLSLMFTVQAAAAQEINVRGQVGRTVEAGGWLINSAKQKYLLLNAERWRGESWFREGAEVEAAGEVRRDVVTSQMEGTPFQARTLRPAGGGGSDSSSSSSSNASLMSGVTRVVVSGDSLVQARPDTAMISVAVVTQAQSALVAQQNNARMSEQMVRALKSAAGTGAEVETSGYSLQPQYNYRENLPPTIKGYEARNTVTVTLGDLSKVGPVIDAATAAGANTIDNLSFTLRRDEPARDQALAAATKEALRKAQVMAVALGGRVGRIIEVQEASSAGRPVPIYAADAVRSSGMARTMQATPVEIGTLDIRAQVQLVAEIITGR